MVKKGKTTLEILCIYLQWLAKEKNKASAKTKNTQLIAYTLHCPPSEPKHFGKNELNYKPLIYHVGEKKHHLSYISRWETDRRDFSKLAPGKKVQVLDLPHGLYGYTFLHRNEMVISSKVVEPFKYEVDVHESIHTPDEYETRAITAWMLQEESDDPYLLEQRPFKIKY